jgi:hypothetical protein
MAKGGEGDKEAAGMHENKNERRRKRQKAPMRRWIFVIGSIDN